MAYGIRKNNKHSFDDFGLTIKSKKIGNPKKNKIKEEIPFMNGSYDFSLLYGDQTYSERKLEYTFNLNEKNKIEMNVKKIQVLEWLNDGGKQPLYDDTIPGFYFLAEVEDDDFSEDGKNGELTVTFNAYPYKIASRNEGNDIWDDFNFELDYMQETKFDVSGSKFVNIINPSSKNINPIVICSSEFNVIKDSTTYKFNGGTTKDWIFTLDKGENNLILNGNGSIEFVFRKEVL